MSSSEENVVSTLHKRDRALLAMIRKGRIGQALREAPGFLQDCQRSSEGISGFENRRWLYTIVQAWSGFLLANGKQYPYVQLNSPPQVSSVLAIREEAEEERPSFYDFDEIFPVARDVPSRSITFHPFVLIEATGSEAQEYQQFSQLVKRIVEQMSGSLHLALIESEWLSESRAVESAYPRRRWDWDTKILPQITDIFSYRGPEIPSGEIVEIGSQ